MTTAILAATEQVIRKVIVKATVAYNRWDDSIVEDNFSAALEELRWQDLCQEPEPEDYDTKVKQLSDWQVNDREVSCEYEITLIWSKEA